MLTIAGKTNLFGSLTHGSDRLVSHDRLLRLAWLWSKLDPKPLTSSPSPGGLGVS